MFKFLVLVIAFVISVILAPLFIPFLKKLKFGQCIREIGPSWHSVKSGTPTMGGLIFIIAISLSIAFFYDKVNASTLLVLICSLGFGLIGFIDDFIKVVLKRNLGLLAWQKLVLQIIVSVAFLFIGIEHGLISPAIAIPFSKLHLNILLYMPFAILVLVFGTNSVNLTDGIDGLAASVTIIVMLCLGALTFNTEASVSAFCFAVVGALIGFLLFNKYPAKVFMGDTGSLFLGGAVCSVALVIGNPLILLVIGFIYFVESLSVIIQVTSFKLTGKRVFKMSPIHHHFEMSGWNEVKIVRVFTALTLALCIIAYLLAG